MNFLYIYIYIIIFNNFFLYIYKLSFFLNNYINTYFQREREKKINSNIVLSIKSNI